MQDTSTAPRTIPIDAIRVMENHNPRTHFKKEAFDRLVDSIRAEGLIQAITVRPSASGDGYELIAGERRLRACRQLAFREVPALVRDVDDITARRLALLENLDRADIGLADEARSAQAHVDAYEGDYAAASKALGWGVQKLKHRLRLLHCAPEVMHALGEEQLTLAHAELLATLPEEAQQKALPRILERNVSVAELREQVNGFATPLAQAIFDPAVAGCGTCPHNSSIQATLFSTVIDDARCTNRQCFSGHTATALEAKRAALREDFGTVVFLTEQVPGGAVPLVLHGEGGVGKAQFDKCRGCALRGARIDDRLGASTGKVDHPLCFDRSCNTERVTAFRESLATPTSDAPEASAPAGTGAPAAESKDAKASAKKATSKSSPAVKATPAAVANQHAGILRRALTARLQTDPTLVLSLALYGLMRTVADETGRDGISAVAKALGTPTAKGSGSHRDTGLPAALARMDKPALQESIVRAATLFFERGADETPFNNKINRRSLASTLIAQLDIDILPHVRIDEDYLSAHTKGGIESLLDESGFADWMKAQDDGDKRLRALLASSKADLVKGVMAAGYPNFASYLPSALTAQAAAWRKEG